jgi:poly(3-hydroxybutyrate) depolymerase
VLARLLCLGPILLAGCVDDPGPPASKPDATTTASDDDDNDSEDLTSASASTRVGSESSGSASTTESATSESGDDGSSSSSTTGEPVGPRPTPGCGAGDPGVLDGMLDVEGTLRTYVLVPPDDYDPDTVYPIIFGFHGAYDSGAGAQLGYRLEEWWEGGAIVVYPDALPHTGVTQWEYASGSADFEFVHALYEEIGTHTCFDQAKAFTFGYSSGGYMAHALGCFRGDLFRGVGAVAGGLSAVACDGPMAIFTAHGDMDTTVPTSAGVAARDHWVAENGCSATTTDPDENGCVDYEDCPAGYPVKWCTYPAAHMFFGWTAGKAVDTFRNLPL